MNITLKDDLYNQLIANGDLEADHLILLSRHYNINILLFGASGSKYGGIQLVVPRIFGEFKDKPVYIISNPNKGHFESVRVYRSNPPIYAISYEQGNGIVIDYASSEKGVSLNMIRKGDTVIWMGKEYIVYDIDFSSSRNTQNRALYYYLTSPENKVNVDAYLKFLKNSQDGVEAKQTNLALWGRGSKNDLVRLHDKFQGIRVPADKLESENGKRPINVALPADLYPPQADATPYNIGKCYAKCDQEARQQAAQRQAAQGQAVQQQAAQGQQRTRLTLEQLKEKYRVKAGGTRKRKVKHTRKRRRYA